MKSKLFLFGLILALPYASVRADSAPDYKRDIVPIFREYCVGCHNAEEANGELSMVSFAALSKGGEHGAAFVAKKSDESRLYLLIAGKAEPKMPPEDNPAPSAEQIELIKRWIDAGAPAPADPQELIPQDPATPEIAPRAPPKPRVYSLAWSSDGKWLAIGQYQKLLIVDLATNHIERSLEGLSGNVTSVSFSTDNARVFVASGKPGVSGEAVIFQIADGARVVSFEGHTDSLYAARYSPDQTLVVTAGYDKLIRVHETSSGKTVREIKGHNDATYALAFRPDGALFASASGDRTVKLWDTKTGERLDTFSESLKELHAAVFTNDGASLLAAGADNRIRRWDISASAKEGTNALRESRFAHEGRVISLAIDPQGKLLASGAEDRSVKIWSLPDVQEKLVLETQSDWPSALVFAPDGTKLAIGRLDGGIGVYDVQSGKRASDIVPTPKPPPPPTLARKIPIGIQAGTTVRAVITGSHLIPGSRIAFSVPGLSASVVSDPPASNSQWTLEVSAASDVPLGRHELKIATPGGETPPLAVFVDSIPQSLESEPNSDGSHAAAIAMPAGVWGSLEQPGDRDLFAFDAQEGQQLVFDAEASGLSSQANLMITIQDSGGKILARSNDQKGAVDPFLAWKAPASGRYFVSVHDLSFTSSDAHFYRLSVGPLPVVTAVYPTIVAVGKETPVTLLGPNIPAQTSVAIKAENAGDAAVPIDRSRFRFRRPFSVAASSAAVLEVEPNNDAASAGVLALPTDIAGRIEQVGDVDLYKFVAQEGEEWIFEVDASRRGSPLDSRIDVLSTNLEPIDRVWLAALRDSYIEFRSIDSAQLEVRCKNWEEMELNELMYLEGEVCKLFRHPRGPDSGFLFHGVGGRRRTYFDTSSVNHALETPVYIVAPYAPGSPLPSTGLPIFKVPYTNDDASDRRLGSDSRLTFQSPKSGEYVLRVIDVQGAGGEEFTYRLICRRPQPAFHVNVSTRTPTVHRGSGREISFQVDRVDGFEGAIDIEVANLPEGIALSQPIQIEAGHESTSVVVTASPEASIPSAEALAGAKWTAKGTISGAPMSMPIAGFQSVNIVDKPAIVVRVEPPEITITPGGTVSAKLIIERKGHNDRVTFEMPGLPHGVIVDNIGLNGILIPEGKTEREFFLSARPFVQPTVRPFFARANEVDQQASASVILKVTPPGGLATAPASNP